MPVIECLEFSVGLSAAEVAVLDHCRRKRHTNVYDQVGAVAQGEALLLPIATTALVSLATVSRGFTPVDGAGFVIVLAAGALADGTSRRALAVLTVAPLLFAVLLGPSGGLGQYGP